MGGLLSLVDGGSIFSRPKKGLVVFVVFVAFVFFFVFLLLPL
jgi:hypothetical protein